MMSIPQECSSCRWIRRTNSRSSAPLPKSPRTKQVLGSWKTLYQRAREAAGICCGIATEIAMLMGIPILIKDMTVDRVPEFREQYKHFVARWFAGMVMTHCQDPSPAALHPKRWRTAYP